MLEYIFFASSILISLQGGITLLWMLYAWENPKKLKQKKSPDKYIHPQHSFTALLPMRHENAVVEDTITAVNKIDYPDHLKETIVICRFDDYETIEIVKNILNKLNKDNILLMTIGDVYPINKPVSLNYGLNHASGDMVCIFDAEDEPHKDIYNIINTVIKRDNSDVVQSGVQLMNYDSNWFSTFNVLEYYLWFKSGLHFFSDIGKVSFLGGNTVFFKKTYLNKIGGWDINNLTEDADIGIRLTLAGAKTSVIYDQRHTTREETPSTIEEFIKQRTRWNQGFLQILAKQDWTKLTKLSQKLVGLYVLIAPLIPMMLFLYIPVGIWFNFRYELPLYLTMLSFIPFYILTMIIFVQIIAMWEFTKIYQKKFFWYLPFQIVLTYIPYLALLTFSAFRSSFRFLLGMKVWEKTSHLNLHRQENLAVLKS